MNYLKVYCNLIRKAENRTPPEGYTERHHIFPKSIFGNNNKIVILTAREHYVAHALLEKIYMNRYGLDDNRTKKMTYAFWIMCNRNKIKTSSIYENLKKRRSNILKELKGEKSPLYGREFSKSHRENLSKSQRKKKLSEEHKIKISKSSIFQKGEKNPNFGKSFTEETRKKLSDANKGKVISEQTKQKISKSTSGEKNHFYGKKHSEETKKKMKDAWIKRKLINKENDSL